MKNKLSSRCEISIVLPCLNEAETLAVCVDKAQAFLKKSKIRGEVIVADNGSTDGSQAIAKKHGARVVPVPVKGYGAALLGGIEAAVGEYVIMADADDSYDLVDLMPFVIKLREGYELVMGNRFKGGIKPGAMKPLHKYLGNPVLSGIGKLFFPGPINDFHCGIRGFSKAAIQKIGLQTTGMEFASEMVVKAMLAKLKVVEVPTTLSKDGRNRPPHLRSWRDGWRHLRFLLVYSPRWLFLIPGLFLTILGGLVMVWLMPGPRSIGTVVLDIHTMLYAAISMIVGVQIIAFAIFSMFFAINIHLLYENEKFNEWMKTFTLEKGLILGGLLSLAGLTGAIYAFVLWQQKGFGNLDPTSMMRLTIPCLTCLAIGMQVMFGSFFLSVLRIEHK